MSKRIGVLSVAIIVIFFAYVFMPKRSFTVDIFPLQKNESVLVYDDLTDGGSSRSSMNVTDSGLEFSCTLGADTSKGAWCGVIWTFTGDSTEKKWFYENWSLVDSVQMDVRSETESEIIVKVWTFDPDVTNKDSLHTFRQMIKEVPLQKGENRVSIAFEDFYVPDFWFAQTGADRELVQRHKEHVARFEITPGWNVKRGIPMKFLFTSIRAKGTGTIELAVFLAISVIVVIVALGFIRKKK